MAAIRPYRPADRDALVALWIASELVFITNDPDDDIALCTKSGHGEILVAEGGGALIGSVMVGHDGHRGWIYYLAVVPAARRRGLGGKLVRAAEDWVSGKGVKKIQLMIRPANRSVAAFYEATGYRAEDRLVMSKRLDGRATF